MAEEKSVSIQFPLVDEDTWISDSTTRTQIPAKGVIVFTYKDTNEGRKIGLRVGDGYNYLGNLPLIDGNDEELVETVKQLQDQLNDLSSNIKKITVFRLRGVFSSLEDVTGPVSGDVALIISNKVTSDAYNSAEEFLYYNEKWERIGSINDWSRVSKLEVSLNELEDTVNNLSAKQLTMDANLTTLSSGLNAEISARQNGDNALQQSLQQEVSTLANTLNEQVDNLTGSIQAEGKDRQEADTLINTRLAEETTERKAKDELLQSDIGAEVEARKKADNELQSAISAEGSIRASTDDQLQNVIDNEKQRAEAQEAILQNRIIAHEEKLSDYSVTQEEKGRCVRINTDYIDLSTKGSFIYLGTHSISIQSPAVSFDCNARIILPSTTYLYNDNNEIEYSEGQRVVTHKELPEIASDSVAGLVKSVETKFESINLGTLYNSEYLEQPLPTEPIYPDGLYSITVAPYDVNSGKFVYEMIDVYRITLLLETEDGQHQIEYTSEGGTFLVPKIPEGSSSKYWIIKDRVNVYFRFQGYASGEWPDNMYLYAYLEGIRETSETKDNVVKVYADGTMHIDGIKANTVHHNGVNIIDYINSVATGGGTISTSILEDTGDGTILKGENYIEILTNSPGNDYVHIDTTKMEIPIKTYVGTMDNDDNLIVTRNTLKEYIPIGRQNDGVDQYSYFGLKNYIDITRGVEGYTYDNGHITIDGQAYGVDIKSDNVYLMGDRITIKDWDSRTQMILDQSGVYINEKQIATQEWVQQQIQAALNG